MYRVLISLMLIAVPAHAINFEHGTFQANTSGGAQAVTMAGSFTPDFVWIYFSFHDALGYSQHGCFAFGIGASTSAEFGLSDFAEDGQTDNDQYSRWDDDQIYVNSGVNGTAPLGDGYASFDISSLGAGTFTITWGIGGNLPDSTYTMHYIAVEGVESWGKGHYGAVMNYDGNYTVNVGTQPDVLFAFGKGPCAGADLTDGASNGTTGGMVMGMCTDSSNQFTWGVNGVENVSPQRHNASISDQHIVYVPNADTIVEMMTVVFGQFNATGWDWNWDGTSGNDAGVYYLWFKLAEGDFFDCGLDTAPASTGTDATTTSGEPAGIMIGMSNADSIVIQDDGAGFSLGFGTESSESSLGYFCQSDVTTSNNATNNNTSSLVSFDNDYDDTSELTASIDSFNSTDFTLNWSATVSGTQYIYAVWGPPAAGAPAGGDTRRLHYLKRWGL